MKKTAIFCALALCSGIASAQSSGFYAGASTGQASVDLGNIASDVAAIATEEGFTNVSSGQKDSDTSWKFFMGYKVNQNFAIEGGYVDLGKYTANVSGMDGGVKATIDASVKSYAYFVDVVGILPLGGDFSLFGKVGGAYTNTKAEASAAYGGVSASDSIKENKFVPKVGAGAEYNITKSIAVRGEFERYMNVGDSDTTGESNVDVWSVGLKFGF